MTSREQDEHDIAAWIAKARVVRFSPSGRDMRTSLGAKPLWLVLRRQSQEVGFHLAVATEHERLAYGYYGGINLEMRQGSVVLVRWLGSPPQHEIVAYANQRIQVIA